MNETTHSPGPWTKILHGYRGGPDDEPYGLTDADALVADAGLDMLAALEEVANLTGETLLGPDSKHRMGEDAPCYHEMGANAAFEQAADIARNALAKETT